MTSARTANSQAKHTHQTGLGTNPLLRRQPASLLTLLLLLLMLRCED